MDIQSFLRMKSLFGQPMAQAGLDTSYGGSTDNMPPPDMPEAPPPADELSSFTPRTAISNQLTDTLTHMPTRPVPGKLRTVAAAIAGMGAGAGAQGIVGGQPIGFKFDPVASERASDSVKYGDFDNQMNDYSNRVKSLVMGANEEDKANAGEVKRMYGEARNDIDARKVEVAQQRADSYQYAQEVKEKAETQKHESAMQKHADNIAKLDATLAETKRAHDLNHEDHQAMVKFHEAELASINARRVAQTEDDKFKLEQMKRMNDARIERTRILNEASPARNKTSTTTMEYDKEGRAIKKTTQSGPTQNLVPVYDKDGNEGFVPADKVDEFIRDHGGSRKDE